MSPGRTHAGFRARAGRAVSKPGLAARSRRQWTACARCIQGAFHGVFASAPIRRGRGGGFADGRPTGKPRRRGRRTAWRRGHSQRGPASTCAG